MTQSKSNTKHFRTNVKQCIGYGHVYSTGICGGRSPFYTQFLQTNRDKQTCFERLIRILSIATKPRSTIHLNRFMYMY